MVVSKSLYAQTSLTEAQNLQKYWYYRERLVNDYLIIGDFHGGSIPAARRIPINNPQVEGPCVATQNILEWGDATISLGWYIGVLATEWKLLSDRGEDVSKTTEELYYALRAFNRIDEEFEYYWSGGMQTGVLNGFFGRDDVPADLIGDPNNPNSNYKHFNSGLYSSSIVKYSTSDFACKGHLAETSQDQIYHIMMGCALVSKLLPSTLQYNNMSLNNLNGNIYFVKEARDITSRMISWLNKDGDWTLKNPITNQCVGPQNNCGLKGMANAKLLSYGIAEAACRITQEPPAIPTNGTPMACIKYHNLFSMGDGYMVWKIFQDLVPNCSPTASPTTIFGPEFEPCEVCQEDLKALLIAAMGNSFFICIPFCGSPVKVINNITAQRIGNRSAAENNEILSLLHSVLYGVTPEGLGISFFNSLLNDAPCYGPYNLSTPGNPNYPHYNWSAGNRFLQPEQRGLVAVSTDCGDFFGGEYNGLDYMLLYNLYRLAYPSSFSIYMNLADRNINASYPLTIATRTIGSHQYPYIHRSVNTIASASNINSDGDVLFKAEKYIDLVNGFNSDAGSFFDAAIEKFICEPTHYDLGGGNTITGLKILASNDTSSGKKTTPQDKLIFISPNPSDGLLTLTFSNNESSELSIYNSIGQIVYYARINSDALSNHLTYLVNLNSLPQGIYFIKVKQENKIYNEKIIIQ